ncbi:hypothetical protein WA158_008310 [Blastocystis sp. Blastoise]
MIQFFLIVNKLGQTRMSVYYEFLNIDQRVQLEGECVRKCLGVKDNQCNFIEYDKYKIIFRRYASIFFIVGVDLEGEDNEIGILEFIHCYVETLDKFFGNVIMFNLERAHFILDEMVCNGEVVDTNLKNITKPLELMEKARAKC